MNFRNTHCESRSQVTIERRKLATMALSRESRSWPALLGGRGFTPCISRRFWPFLPWHPNTPWFLERGSSVNTLCVTLASLNLVLLRRNGGAEKRSHMAKVIPCNLFFACLGNIILLRCVFTNLPRCLHKNTTIHFSSFPTRALLQRECFRKHRQEIPRSQKS